VPVAAIVNPSTSLSLRAGPAVIQTCSVPGSVITPAVAGFAVGTSGALQANAISASFGTGTTALFSLRVTERYPAALTSGGAGVG